MHICTHFFAVPMNNQRNSHTEAGVSRIHILLQSTQHLQYHLLLFLQAVLTLWGPSPGMVFQTQTACAAKPQLSAQNPLFLSYIHIHGTSQMQSKCPVFATKLSQHFCGTLSFVPSGHRSATCSEPTVPSQKQC